jgi:hypothetical protein
MKCTLYSCLCYDTSTGRLHFSSLVDATLPNMFSGHFSLPQDVHNSGLTFHLISSVIGLDHMAALDIQAYIRDHHKRKGREGNTSTDDITTKRPTVGHTDPRSYPTCNLIPPPRPGPARVTPHNHPITHSQREGVLSNRNIRSPYEPYSAPRVPCTNTATNTVSTATNTVRTATTSRSTTTSGTTTTSRVTTPDCALDLSGRLTSGLVRRNEHNKDAPRSQYQGPVTDPSNRNY